MRIPNRSEVTREFSEKEAFEHAAILYDDWITKNTPSVSSGIVAELEQLVYRPAVELQLAGLSILGGKELNSPANLALSFSCFAVDHLLWGWFAAVNLHPRIAFSLTRSALEASIFEIAVTKNCRNFMEKWNSHRGTGGSVLRELSNIPDDLKWLLMSAWKLLVSQGHASSGPVLSASTLFMEGSKKKVGVSFAGQFGGALDVRQLNQCINGFCLTSHAAVHAMNIGLKPILANLMFGVIDLMIWRNKWGRRYQFQNI